MKGGKADFGFDVKVLAGRGQAVYDQELRAALESQYTDDSPRSNRTRSSIGSGIASRRYAGRPVLPCPGSSSTSSESDSRQPTLPDASVTDGHRRPGRPTHHRNPGRGLPGAARTKGSRIYATIRPDPLVRGEGSRACEGSGKRGALPAGPTERGGPPPLSNSPRGLCGLN